MKKLFAVSIAALMALAPMLGTAHAQTHSSAEPRIEQRAPQGPQARTQRWKKGERYSGRGARVSNYRQHNLKAPPKGHRWVRDGNDFLLVAIGTGVIASIANSR